MDVGDIINQYLGEANLDTDLDRLEVVNTQERLVNNKHKWSARLINHKINLSNLKFKRESALEEKVTEYQNTEPVRVNRNIAERAVQRAAKLLTSPLDESFLSLLKRYLRASGSLTICKKPSRIVR